MGSTTKTSNWMGYFILVSLLLLILSCGVDAAEPVQVNGDQLVLDGSETVEAVKGAVDWTASKIKAQQEYAKSEEGKAKAAARKEKTKEVLDTTGEVMKDATHWTADKVGDLARWVEKKTK